MTASMNSTNGTYGGGSEQYSQDQTDDATSEVFYQLIQASIPEDVASQVNDLVCNGILAPTDITERVQAELVNLPVDLMTVITNELSTSDVSNLKNKAAYLTGLIKTQKKKVPGLANLNSSSSDMPAVDTSVEIGQLPVTYGKHYKHTGLGPNVNEEAVKRLLARTGYPMDLSPGQRHYGPPPNWNQEKPGKGCEVFIGGLLRETFEDTLVPMLENCGTIYELRIMTNPTDGVNKGFAFCIFSSKEEAKTCVSRLNGKSMGRSRVLKVNVHDPNTRLFVGGVDKSKTRDQIMLAIGSITEGLVDVILKGDTEHPQNKHRGFVFLDYDQHKQASSAIKKLMLPQTFVFGKNLFADWAEPMAEVSDEIMATVKVLYVKGLTMRVNEEVLKDRFSPYGAIDSVKKLKDYAFVHFQHREDALQAMNDLNGMRVEDATIEVTLAKPGNKKKDAPGSAGPMRGGHGGSGMRGGHPPPLMGRTGGGPPRGGFGAPRGGFGGTRGGRGGRGGGSGGGYAGDGYGGGRDGGYRGGGRGGLLSRGVLSRGAPSRGAGGRGAPGRGGAMSRGGPRGTSRGVRGGGRPTPGGGYRAGSESLYDDYYSSDGGYGDAYESASAYRPALSAVTRAGRGGGRGGAPPRGIGYAGQRDPAGLDDDPRGGYRGAAASMPPARAPMKRAAPPSLMASAYSGYDAYEAPPKRPRETAVASAYDSWGAIPIAQQPLSSRQAYGVGEPSVDPWNVENLHLPLSSCG